MSQQWPADPNPYPNASWGGTYSGVHVIPAPVPQQPTIIQQLPGDFISPLSYPVRAGRAKEDLMDLMMIQNAQMYQVIMNNMTMSTLSSFGHTLPPPPPPPPPQPSVVPVQVEEEEPIVYHHHYEPYPANYMAYPTYPVLPLPAPMPHREPTVRHVNMDIPPPSPAHNLDLPAVPPPPPLSATGTVGADIPPASEYYDLTEARV